MTRTVAFAFLCLFTQLAPGALASELAIGSTTRKYPGVRDFVRKVASDFKGNASLFSLGVSDSGEEILGLKIGEGPVRNLVVAAHHGNEYASTELALAFAESVARQPIPGQATYVIPVLNITGYNSRRREERAGNGRSYDPNRNYPGPCGTEGPFTLKSTKLLADFLVREQITSSATLHTYTPAVLYPWGHSTRDTKTAYPAIFHRMVDDATIESRYKYGNSAELVYPADGTFEDYAFVKHGIWSILFELGYSHSPGDRDMQTMISVNLPGLRRMFENAPKETATDHAFKGRCDPSLRALDRREE